MCSISVNKPKLNVAILFGGRSVEHAVSVNSARNILQHIDRGAFYVICIGISKKGSWFLTSEISKEIESGVPLSLSLNINGPIFHDKVGNQYPIDMVFPVLHGTDGEDGSIQGLLKALRIPVVGSGVLGSCLSMSKLVTKKLLQQAGLSIAKFIAIRENEVTTISFSDVTATIGLPFMVKSANLGSSVGVSKVSRESEFQPAIAEAFRYDNCVIIEEYIVGRELECAVMGNEPPVSSRPGEIVLKKDYAFYNFEAKYVDAEAVRIDVPAVLDNKTIEQIRELSIKAYQALHCEDFARVDLFLGNDGIVYINEINTIPGFTNSSMFPLMWKEQGISFTELISKLIMFAIDRTEKGKRIQHEFQSALKY